MPSGSFFDGSYHSVVVTWNGTTEVIFIDGVNVAQRNPVTAPSVGAANFVVGKTIGDANFKGWLDDVLIASRALSAAEITNLLSGAFSGSLASVLPTSTALQVAPGATLDLNGVNQQVGSLADSGGAGGSVVNGNTGAVSVLALSPDGTAAFSGQIQGGGALGPLGLIKNGAGAQTLSGSNTYAGGTLINYGTLVANSTTALGASTGSLVVSAGGVLQANTNIALGTVSIAGGTIGGVGAATTLTAGGFTSTGGTVFVRLAGAGGLTHTGGTLSLYGNNTYAGATVVSSGTLRLAGIPAGTQAYYTFDNAANVGQDFSGNGNTLVTASGAPAYTNSGKFAGALYLDGNSTLTPASGQFPTGIPTNNSPYTVAAWIKPDTGCSLTGGWVGWGNRANSQANNFRLGGANNNVWAYWWNNDFGGAMSSGNFFDGPYHSVVATWDGATEIIFIDGASVAQRTPATLPAVGAANFVVGKTINDANFKGWLDGLLIANRALSPAEITSFQTFSGTCSLPAGAALRVAAGAVMDLNGNSQSVASLSGGGAVTGGTLTVTGCLTPGDTNTVISALTVHAGLVLSANATNVFDSTQATSDVVRVAGTLTLQGPNAVQISFTGARPPAREVALFTFNTLIGATNLANWSVSGCPSGYKAKLIARTSAIVLSVNPTGTLIMER